MAQDPVLQREMFNPRDRSAKGSGITSMVDDGSSGMTREERLQMAKDMLAEAQMKQSPEYYFKTLAQGDRPAMTRPVASSAPPPAMQQMPAAQQMAQMQAAGVRPVGMADGGIVRRGFAEAGLVKKDDPYGLEALKSDPAWSNLTFDQRNQLAVEQYNKVAAQRPEAQSRPSIDLLTPEYLGSEDAEKFKDRLTDQSNLSFEERNAKEARAKDKYYDDKAEQILKDRRSGDYLNKYSEDESPTAFGRIGDSAEKYAADRQKEQKARIKKSLMLQDANAGSDSVENAFNLLKDESSIDRSLRQANEERMRSNIEKYGSPDRSLTTTPEKDALDKRDYAQEREGIASLARETEDAAARERAMPDKRDYAQEREGIASLARINADQALRDQAMPDKRDYDQERLARREAIRIPEDPTLQGKSAPPVKIISGVPGAAVAQDQAGAAAKDQAGAAAQEPAKYSATTTLESIKSERAKEREDNFNMALIQAGLAMMGGKSSNALANIGEGGMQGIKQFSEQERESSRGYREDVKAVRDEERFGRTYDQNERMQAASLAAQADVARATRDASAIQQDADRALKSMLGSRELELREKTETRNDLDSIAARALNQVKENNKKAYDDGTLSIQGLNAANAKAETDSQIQYRKDSTRLEERKLFALENKVPEEITAAAFAGGWRPDGKGTQPTDEQLLAGMDKLNEIDLNKSLEKIINSPFADQELKDKASARFSATLDRISAKNPQAFKEGQTATGPNGQKVIFKSGAWVKQ